MAFGILEPRDRSVHVAGTVTLDQKAAHTTGESLNLKHASGKNANLVLAPQPSADPNDPLNWSWFEKHLIFAILSLGTIVCGSAIGPLTAAGTVDIAIDLQVSVNAIAQVTGYCLIATGATGPFVSALARKYGKRPLYIFSSLISVVGCIIGETATSYTGFLAARVVQGLGVSAYESLVMGSISDIFFLHERGARVAIFQFLLAAVSNAISIIAGPITTRLGWPYNFHILLPFAAFQLILLVLFVPETTYRRSAMYNIDTLGSSEDLDALAAHELRKERHAAQRSGQAGYGEKEGQEMEETAKVQRQISTLSAPPPPRKSFVKRLKVYNGVFVEDSVFKMVLAFVVSFGNIGILYNTIISGVIIAFFVAISILSAVLFYAPPYLFDAAEVGYCSAGPLIGGILGALFMGFASEPLNTWLIKKNKGVYEPEFRLVPLIIGGIFSVGGLVGFGYAVGDGLSIYVVCVMWAMLLFGMTIVATALAGYTVDAFRDYATEAFVANMFFKNFFFFGLSQYIINWYLTKGVKAVFNTCGGLAGALCVITIPLYVYGKRYRLHWQQHNLIKKFNLETDKLGAEGE